MSVDWPYAALVSGVGFGLVFAILLILDFFIWLTGKVVPLVTAGKPAAAKEKPRQAPKAGADA